jgi:hypothetical protein
VEIPKPGGKGVGVLGIATTLDRLIQQALLQVMQPMFDPTFWDHSFGYRPRRSWYGRWSLATPAVSVSQLHLLVCTVARPLAGVAIFRRRTVIGAPRPCSVPFVART